MNYTMEPWGKLSPSQWCLFRAFCHSKWRSNKNRTGFYLSSLWLCTSAPTPITAWSSYTERVCGDWIFQSEVRAFSLENDPHPGESLLAVLSVHWWLPTISSHGTSIAWVTGPILFFFFKSRVLWALWLIAIVWTRIQFCHQTSFSIIAQRFSCLAPKIPDQPPPPRGTSCLGYTPWGAQIVHLYQSYWHM